MITVYDVKNQSGYFCECAKQAFSLLRFSSITEILKMEQDCKHLIANIVENLSKSAQEAHVFLDLLSKTVIERYVPDLKQSARYITGDKSEKFVDSISKIVDKTADYVTDRLKLSRGSVDIVEDSAAYIEPNVDDYGFRDALQITKITKKIYDADESLTEAGNQKMDEVEAKYGVFYEKYNNEVVSKINQMRTLLSRIQDLRSVLDSCVIAKYLRNYYNLTDEKSLVDFLNCSDFELINKAATATKHFKEV